MPTTGPDLRAERRAADVTVKDLAARIQPRRTRQTIHGWERAATLTKDQVAQYRAALIDAIVASEERVA